jgi:hypothetical protein
VLEILKEILTESKGYTKTTQAGLFNMLDIPQR